MNLGNPELELIDPTPNVHALFMQFDKLFFWTKLASRAVVRWSKRMYSCAGICSYDRGGLCDIALSEPLLKLRPRKDLIETLLHEMIHAYLFITNRDRDRDGHGPNFQAHMHRINGVAGLNISIYHDFHDEVKLYQTHWWRCNGPCQSLRPRFGIIRRSYNRAPGPTDFWWEDHRRKCGGSFVKIKEPESTRKKAVPAKSNGDITKYVNIPKSNGPQNFNNRPVLKDSNNIPVKMKGNGAGTVVITKKDPIFNPKPVQKPPVPFVGTGRTIDPKRNRSSSVSVLETVRNVWTHKKLPESPNQITKNKPTGLNKVSKPPKMKRLTDPIDSTPSKIKKIDDYFNRTSTMLKDIYGKDIAIAQGDKKIVAVPSDSDKKLIKTEISSNPISKSSNTKYVMKPVFKLVNCPVCNAEVSSNEINKHLDECLNKEVINSIKGEERILSQSPPVMFSSNIYVPVKKSDNLNNTVPKYLNVDHELSLAIAKVEKEINSDYDEYKNCNDLNEAKELIMNLKYEQSIPNKRQDGNIKIKTEKEDKPKLKIEPGTSQDSVEFIGQICACCGNEITVSIDEHLEECLAFFANNQSIPKEGASTSLATETVVIDDDDDILDESLILNDTGSKFPCPCCFKMIEVAEMNEHLDMCLN